MAPESYVEGLGVTTPSTRPSDILSGDPTGADGPPEVRRPSFSDQIRLSGDEARALRLAVGHRFDVTTIHPKVGVL